MSNLSAEQNFMYWTEPHNYLKFFDNMFSSQVRDIYIGSIASGNPELELSIIEKQASYGRQLGWLLDAMVIIARKLQATKNIQLTEEEQLAFSQLYILKRNIEEMKKNAQLTHSD